MLKAQLAAQPVDHGRAARHAAQHHASQVADTSRELIMPGKKFVFRQSADPASDLN
jgi:hypothetical protein